MMSCLSVGTYIYVLYEATNDMRQIKIDAGSTRVRDIPRWGSESHLAD